ncbi:unnamed protein product [Spirodela intermedia]|uniref:F-box associated beta-propeller type 1 domain-containing protein n=1 Tax=Spirodela intermedia TaxID=51605 RepID=A0A7I8J8G2_SPIIN|nr:unnamed protein product [Spirodela intermedia]CAA6666374.1 unnamed protein product [Spirodela intermedia]
MATCRHWRACAVSHPAPRGGPRREGVFPWFLAVCNRAAGAGSPPCFVYVPELRRWHILPLDFLHFSVRLVSPVAAGLLLCRLGTGGRLLLCNPFTRQHRLLPELMTPRSSPAVGVVAGGAASFKVFVAGGATAGGYEPTLEVYDSKLGSWRRAGTTPAGFAVRLTVWTPNECVVAGGVVYWMTSARAYSVMGLEVATGAWREVKAPLAERLQWAALVERRSGQLGLVGGCGGAEGRVWELVEGDEWVVVGEVPAEAVRGREGEVYLYGELGQGMAVGRELEGRWEWEWVDGCFSVLGAELKALPGAAAAPLKGVLLHPTLSPSFCFLHQDP